MSGNAVVLRMGVSPTAAADGAFDRVFRAEYARAVGIARRVLGNESLAEDVAQDAFLALHRRHASDQPWAGAWVCAAAAHGALNVLRADRRRARRERTSPSATVSVDPGELVERADDARVLREALGALPVRSATVLVLRHSGLSYAEVAAAMGVKQRDVGTMVRRAEAALRKEVGRAASQ